MYDSDAGRFCSRDPIGYYGSKWSTYAFVNGRPLDFVDPLGLFSVAGIDDDDRFIYGGGGGGCYIYVNNRRIPVPCPKPPVDDIDGTKYGQGLDSIHQGISVLQNMCEQRGSNNCCSKSDCQEEAMEIIHALTHSWQNNYGNGPWIDDPKTGGDPVGGYHCWMWTLIFADALSSVDMKCFGAETLVMIKPGGKKPLPDGQNWYPQHWFIDLDVCGGSEHCTLDDGFLGGHPGCVHEGSFPPDDRPDWIDPTVIGLPPGKPQYWPPKEEFIPPITPFTPIN